MAFSVKENPRDEESGWFLQKNVSCSETTWWPSSSRGALGHFAPVTLGHKAPSVSGYVSAGWLRLRINQEAAEHLFDGTALTL